MMSRLRRIPSSMSALFCILCSGCQGWQSAMDPAGPQSRHLTQLFWIFLIVCGAIWGIVLITLTAALWRRRVSLKPPGGPAERRTARVVIGAVVASALVIAGLTLSSYFTTRSLASVAGDPIVLRVRGYQWWWEITYMDSVPSHIFLTANEIHIPMGRTVRIQLSSADVIHSFWAPNLMGKQDLIPGRDNAITFSVDRPGVYREQCAEFCGLQHAHMALLIVAEPQAAFDAWRTNQVAEPFVPHDAEQAEGRRVFTSKACANCHTIRGTPAAGTLGPDLTHVGSRQTIAAGMLPMTRGALAAWIADPQTIKPGNNMPMVSLNADELNAVSAYLAGLR
jgi:cytochrome c oxidase subunit 2